MPSWGDDRECKDGHEEMLVRGKSRNQHRSWGVGGGTIYIYK